MDNNEKIQLDDITLDDVISGDGVETISNEEPVVTEEKVEEVSQETKEVEEDLPEEVETDTEEVKEEEIVEDEKKSDEDVEDKPDTVVSEILTKLGYETDSKYDDTSEGLANMTVDVASQMAGEKVDEVLKKFPMVKQHLEYVLSGGQSQDFMQAHDPNLDYEKVKFEEDDHRSQKAVLSDYFTLKGHDKEFVKEMVQDYEDNGKLFKKAEAAKQALAKAQGEHRGQLMEKQNAQRKEQQTQMTDFWNGVADTIQNSEEFSGITVPDREKEGFFNYLSAPVNQQGMTKRDVDHQEAPLETKLAIDYLMFKGFNLDKLINTKARTKSVRSLRDRIGQNEEHVKSARRSTRRSKSVDLDDLDLTI